MGASVRSHYLLQLLGLSISLVLTTTTTKENIFFFPKSQQPSFLPISHSLRSRSPRVHPQPLFNVVNQFEATIPFNHDLFEMTFRLKSKQVYTHDGISVPVVSFTANDLIVNGTVVLGSFANVILVSLEPLVVDGHIFLPTRYLLLKPWSSVPGGSWEKTKIYEEFIVDSEPKPDQQACEEVNPLQDYLLRPVETVEGHPYSTRGKRETYVIGNQYTVDLVSASHSAIENPLQANYAQ